jgi:hypothetical protein
MPKRRIYWPYGNPKFDAWEMESAAGRLVLRRNHELRRHKGGRCQGWDVWLNGRYLGAVGSRGLAELVALSRRNLKALVRPACCGRHAEFAVGRVLQSRPGWGGRRANAGRPRKASGRRVDLATTVDPRTLELIDQQRGPVSRGEYLDRLVQAHLRP